ncbi:hypothetical protein MKW98_026852 [Papaver atlanticum]|uniref:Ribosomal protein S3 n=1 Tax=Papaver atlanticum TaxID=357466 RepID=A0AAD4RZY6_9MAGN|nr:hypothetical protein MKW98_026852 [Papaver atlanticum]
MVIVSGKLRAARAKSMKFKDGYMISFGHYIDSAVRQISKRWQWCNWKTQLSCFLSYSTTFFNRVIPFVAGHNSIARSSQIC